MSSPWKSAPPRGLPETVEPARSQRDAELRLYGRNAVRALFVRRPRALRKLYLAQEAVDAFRDVLKWCATQRVGYRIVPDDDLRKLAASSHHEGVVADVLREPPQELAAWLRELPAGRICALWLDGVGNPHNLGAILRSAAHFGVAGILIPHDGTLALSGAAARVAEGGAEAVPLVRLPAQPVALQQLRAAGFSLWATLVRGGDDVFATAMPERLIYVMGAEQHGMDHALIDQCDARVSIPGSGAVDSLNVAAATAVLLAQWWRG